MNRRQVIKMTAGAAVLGLAGSNSLISTAIAAGRQNEIKAIAFDGFPIFDPRPILALAKKLYPEQGEAFGKMWFNKIFSYT